MRKNKWDIIAKEISKIEGQSWYYDYDYYDYDDDSCDPWCDCWRCSPDYDYEPLSPTNDWRIISRRSRIGMVKLIEPSMGGRFIDMSSIYPIEILREKKINLILGIDMDPVAPTFGDIFKNIDNK